MFLNCYFTLKINNLSSEYFACVANAQNVRKLILANVQCSQHSMKTSTFGYEEVLLWLLINNIIRQLSRGIKKLDKLALGRLKYIFLSILISLFAGSES